MHTVGELPHGEPRRPVSERVLVIVGVRGSLVQNAPRGALLVEQRTSIDVRRRSIVPPHASRAVSASPLAARIDGTAGEAVFRNCVR